MATLVPVRHSPHPVIAMLSRPKEASGVRKQTPRAWVMEGDATLEVAPSTHGGRRTHLLGPAEKVARSKGTFQLGSVTSVGHYADAESGRALFSANDVDGHGKGTLSFAQPPSKATGLGLVNADIDRFEDRKTIKKFDGVIQ